jgi:hypothetical protein
MAFFAAAALLSQPHPQADLIRQARELGAAELKLATANPDAKLMFMQDAEDDDKWSPMATEESHLDSEGFWAAGDVAFVWRRNDQVRFMMITKGSASGDWSARGEYAYRADGSLARIYMNYSALSPIEGSVVRERFFDTAGKVIHEGVKATSLGGDRLLTGESAREIREYERPFSNFTRAQLLPFFPKNQPAR